MLQFCRCTVATHGSTEAKVIPLPFSSTLEAANMHMPCSTHYTQGLDRANFIGRSKSQGLETGVLKSGTASNLVTAVTLFFLALYPLKNVSAATCQPLGIWNMKHSKHIILSKKKNSSQKLVNYLSRYPSPYVCQGPCCVHPVWDNPKWKA